MTRKVDPVVECIAAAECAERRVRIWCEPNDRKEYGWCADCQGAARRIKRDLSRAGWLKEGRR